MFVRKMNKKMDECKHIHTHVYAFIHLIFTSKCFFIHIANKSYMLHTNEHMIYIHMHTYISHMIYIHTYICAYPT